MGRRPKFSREFIEEAVRLARQPGHTYKSVGADLGVSREAVRKWAIKLDAESDPIVRQARAERAELLALRRRVRVLEEERQILAKAVAFRARETERDA
jgi:transposase